MKKRKIIAKLMVLSMIISNVSGINVQATDNIDVQNDNSIEYNVDTENSETFEELNVDKNIISNETVENDDLILNENEIFEVMEEIKKLQIEAPVKIGDIVEKNILDLNVDLIAAKNIEKISSLS